MIETHTYITRTKLEPADLQPVLLGLAASGWKPALLESERAFLGLAGVPTSTLSAQTRRPRYGTRYPPEMVGGDVFFQEKGMFYLATYTGGRALWERYSGRQYYRTDESGQPELEVGVVSVSADDSPARLRDFAEAVEGAVKSSLDGRKTRHMAFEWRHVDPGRPRLDALLERESAQPSLGLTRATLVADGVEASQALASKAVRTLLIDLSQAGFARRTDIIGRSGGGDSQTALEALLSHGLVDTEYLLECRKAGTHLTRLRDPSQLSVADVGSLKCPSCGTSFDQERVSDGFSPSDVGRRLCRRSHWMTVWITQLLSQLGVPADSIVWNVSESGEEVDLLVDFLGRLWIFELKDREFGAGDAYPLNYRQVRYRADRAVIVTTEKVSKDAKRVFDELARGSSRPHGSGPVYVEGLDHAARVLGREISTAALRYANRWLAPLSALSGYNLGAILSARLGEPFEDSMEDFDTEQLHWLPM